jgi:hypothetical protein
MEVRFPLVKEAGILPQGLSFKAWQRRPDPPNVVVSLKVGEFWFRWHFDGKKWNFRWFVYNPHYLIGDTGSRPAWYTIPIRAYFIYKVKRRRQRMIK